METDTKPLNRMVNDINAGRQVKILKPLWLLLLHVCTTVCVCVCANFFSSDFAKETIPIWFFTIANVLSSQPSWIVVCIAYSAVQLSWFYLNIFSSFQLKSMQNQTDTRNNNNCPENQAEVCANMDKSIAIVEEANEWTRLHLQIMRSKSWTSRLLIIVLSLSFDLYTEERERARERKVRWSVYFAVDLNSHSKRKKNMAFYVKIVRRNVCMSAVSICTVVPCLFNKLDIVSDVDGFNIAILSYWHGY